MPRILPILIGSAALAYASNVYAAEPQKVRDLIEHVKVGGIVEIIDGYHHHRLPLKGSQIDYPDPNAEILLVVDRVQDGIPNAQERGLYVIIEHRNVKYIDENGKPLVQQKQTHLQDGRVRYVLGNVPTNSNPDGIVDSAADNVGLFNLSDPSSLQTAQSEFDKVVDGAHKLLFEKK